jgi:hypothetical protein
VGIKALKSLLGIKITRFYLPIGDQASPFSPNE